ncbi:MAG: hypothetical protein M3413_02755 [Bacteroidota bacterium]|nr:hypothetical protein [Bacteroidota bacterium]
MDNEAAVTITTIIMVLPGVDWQARIHYRNIFDGNGDTTYSPIHKGACEAGTCVSTKQSTIWYCDRDKIQFGQGMHTAAALQKRSERI